MIKKLQIKKSVMFNIAEITFTYELIAAVSDFYIIEQICNICSLNITHCSRVRHKTT